MLHIFIVDLFNSIIADLLNVIVKGFHSVLCSAVFEGVGELVSTEIIEIIELKLKHPAFLLLFWF